MKNQEKHNWTIASQSIYLKHLKDEYNIDLSLSLFDNLIVVFAHRTDLDKKNPKVYHEQIAWVDKKEDIIYVYHFQCSVKNGALSNYFDTDVYIFENILELNEVAKKDPVMKLLANNVKTFCIERRANNLNNNLKINLNKKNTKNKI